MTLASLDSTTIQVCWEKIPYFPTLDGYEVLYKPFNQTSVSEVVTLTNANVSSVIIRALEPYKTYSVTVAGKTIAGLGRRSLPETLQPTNYTSKYHCRNFSNRAFSNDITSAMPYWCTKTMKRWPCWCSKPIPWELEVFSYVKMEVLTFGLDIYLLILLYLINAKLESREKSILLYFQWSFCSVQNLKIILKLNETPKMFG